MDKKDKKAKKEYQAPKMWDTDNFTPPHSAYADSYHEMLTEQMQETMSAVVAAETWPDTREYIEKNQKKIKKIANKDTK